MVEPKACPTHPVPGMVPDRRSESRQISVILFAKLVAGATQLPCRVLNMSNQGVKVETRLPLQTGDPVIIEFRSDLTVPATVRWAGSGRAGIQFDAPINLAALLRRSDFCIERFKARPPRYHCNAPVLIKLNGQCVNGNAVDISSTGLKVRCPNDFRANIQVVVEIAGMPRHKARVMWTSPHAAGLKFVNPVKFHELEMWLYGQGAPVQAASA